MSAYSDGYDVGYDISKTVKCTYLVQTEIREWWRGFSAGTAARSIMSDSIRVRSTKKGDR
jgi:hypothetical protein